MKHIGTQPHWHTHTHTETYTHPGWLAGNRWQLDSGGMITGRMEVRNQQERVGGAGGRGMEAGRNDPEFAPDGSRGDVLK